MSITSSPSIWQPGLQLDRYELVCKIAQGGMATVWVARLRGKRGFEKLVAVKVVLPEYAAETRFQQMFLDEARLAANIEHPNVVQTFDLGELGDSLYLVMEWVNGYSLQTLLREVQRNGASVPLGVALRMMADACAGLHAAHELRNEQGQPLGVVHRDVSPHNILVSMRGVAKVIDFGIAKARDRSAGATTTGELKGKANFMPAEQVLGDEIDRRTDVWALGAVLYFLLTGRTPYHEANQFATFTAVVNGAPYDPLPPSTPLAVAAIVDRALAFAPHDRFETAEAMMLAVETAMADLKVTAGPAQVAACVNEHLGELAHQRRDKIRTALLELDRLSTLDSLSDSQPGVASSLQGPPSHWVPTVRLGAAPPHDPTMVSQTASATIEVSVSAARAPGARRLRASAAVGGLALALGGAMALGARLRDGTALTAGGPTASLATLVSSAPQPDATPGSDPVASRRAPGADLAASKREPGDDPAASKREPAPSTAAHQAVAPAGRLPLRARPPAAPVAPAGAPAAAPAPAGDVSPPAGVGSARRKYRRDY